MKTHLLTLLVLIGVSFSRLGAAESPKLIVHEWGTFTSVQGADGVQLEWNPLVRTELPSFVYDISKLPANGDGALPYPGKAALRAFVRMETPVIYFYSPVETAADVHVDFPQGRITEWYPRANRFGSAGEIRREKEARAGQNYIEWKGVKILSPVTTEISGAGLLREGNGNHYYEARETAANLLRVDAEKREGNPEYERLLFYRGVGSFKSPLEVKVDSGEGELQLSTANPDPLTDLFILTIDGERARYTRIKELTPATSEKVALSSIPFAPLQQVRRQLMADMKRALVGCGLYADEAAAMLNTWKDQWLAEKGTRVLYLLPRKWTDGTLPLSLNPTPSELVRVMVGRSEVIEPGIERELRKEIADYASGDPVAQQHAVAKVRRLGMGRFLEPAVTRVLGATPEAMLADSAWKLVNKALAQKGSDDHAAGG